MDKARGIRMLLVFNLAGIRHETEHAISEVLEGDYTKIEGTADQIALGLENLRKLIAEASGGG